VAEALEAPEFYPHNYTGEGEGIFHIAYLRSTKKGDVSCYFSRVSHLIICYFLRVPYSLGVIAPHQPVGGTQKVTKSPTSGGLGLFAFSDPFNGGSAGLT
jgi:hypothetical protein